MVVGSLRGTLMKLKDKVAVITGGNSGIGLAAAKESSQTARRLQFSDAIP